MTRRLVVLGLVGLAVVVAWLVFNPIGELQSLVGGTGDESSGAAPRGRSEVAIRDLSRTVESEGTLELSAGRIVSTSAGGTITGLPTVGTAIDRSMTLFEVDGYPTVALVGDVPAWRELSVDSVGSDVEQLESNLLAMGYDSTGDLSVDDTYTDFTAALVEQWQTDLGVDVSGSIPEGFLVFVPEDSKVVDVPVAVGDLLVGGGDTGVLVTASSARTLEVVVPASELESIALDDEVTATLPDGSTVTGVVAELSSAGDGSWVASVPVDEVDADGDELPDGESVPVSVSWTDQLASDAKTVPANSLSRLDTGSYVVEVVVDGGTSFVEVELGQQVGSNVEVDTDLEPGTVIVTP